MAKVGIFFFVSGKVIYDAVPVEDGEAYGDTRGFGGHFEFWEKLLPKTKEEGLFKDKPYDYFPRGRVIYYEKSGKFQLFADRCLKKTDIEKVVILFALQKYQVARDEHYVCSGCNPDYVDI